MGTKLAETLATLAVALAALAAAALLREAGSLERVDLALHDRLVRSVYEAGSDDRFVVVLEREQDLARWGFPLPDETLALLVEKVVSAGALAVGIDKYRDQPVAPGSERLDALLAASDRVYWVEKFGGAGGKDGIAPPRALDPKFVGCADVVEDADGHLRRALLYVDAGERYCYSLALQLARHAAAALALQPRFTSDAKPKLAFGRASLAAIDPGEGPYVTADTAGFQVAVPSAAGLPAMKTVALGDVLDGRFDAEAMRGRVVLFGSAAESLRDFFSIPTAGTPEGVEKITGVQAHALAASYLLRSAQGQVPAMRLARASLTHELAALLALLGAAIGTSRRRIAVVIAAGAGVLLLFALAVWAIATQGLFLAPSAPALALLLALAGGIAHRAWREGKERAELMQIFSQHVSPEIADELWKRRGELMGEGVVRPRHIEATVFFLDIRSFTTYSEVLPPETAVPWLNRGLSVMTDIIMRHNGVVTRFSGDAIMAVFGAPLPRTLEAQLAADAEDAIDASIAISLALDKLNAEFSADGLPPIRVRIGINSGSMTQCSVGMARRTEFTLLGDVVNTAARLESYPMEDDGRTVRLLIGERTMALAGRHYNTRYVGTVALKGKGLPVSFHQVLLPG